VGETQVELGAAEVAPVGEAEFGGGGASALVGDLDVFDIAARVAVQEAQLHIAFADGVAVGETFDFEFLVPRVAVAAEGLVNALNGLVVVRAAVGEAEVPVAPGE
jgi:hypothetical protein